MLGVFAKVVRGETVKSRLQTALTRQEAERFHIASLADTLETALRLDPRPFLFLQGDDAEAVEDLRGRLGACGLETATWAALCVCRQRDGDLGSRLEQAFETLSTQRAAPGPALILGSDSPSLPPAYLGAGMERLGWTAAGLTGAKNGWRGAKIEGRVEESTRPADPPHTRSTDQQRDRTAANRSDPYSGDASTLSVAPALPSPRGDHHETVADLVLGPTTDGGYWGIGLRRPYPGLLQEITWSSTHTFDDTLKRAASFGLRTALLPLWTDVDRPEDLRELSRQIDVLRQSGDPRTARHSERFLAEVGIHHD